MKVFGSYLCTSNPVPTIDRSVNNGLPADIFDLIEKYAYAGQPAAGVPAPACKEQAPLGNLIGQFQRYPHLLVAPEAP
jgi:hypothetical protein